MRPNGLQDLINRYGKPWASPEDADMFERKHMALWHSRNWEKSTGLVWPSATTPFNRIYCNNDLVPLLDQTFSVLLKAGRLQEIISFDGCWNVRMKRGQPTKPSIHCFGLALDFNAHIMPLGTNKCLWSDEFLQIMDECGWILGAEFPNPDPMHFQWAEGY